MFHLVVVLTMIPAWGYNARRFEITAGHPRNGGQPLLLRPYDFKTSFQVGRWLQLSSLTPRWRKGRLALLLLFVLFICQRARLVGPAGRQSHLGHV